MAEYSPDQLAEIEKILNFIQQMEAIIRTSPSREQVDRVRKQIGQYVDKLINYMPHLNRSRIVVEEIRRELGLSGRSAIEAKRNMAEPQRDVLARFPIEPASPHSTDPDVNFLATVLRVIQREYWPVISDQHIKLDFSHGAERDSLRNKMEGAHRNLKVLTETIEEYALAENQDFREQLLKMKNKHTRVFMYELNGILKKMNEFLRKLVNDLNTNGNIIMNKGEILKFNPHYEEARELDGISLDQGIRDFSEYTAQAIKRLNLPEIKISS